MSAPLQLDFLRSPPRHRMARLVLAGIALAFACDVGIGYVSLRAEVAQKEARLAKAPAYVQDAPAPARAVSPEEFAFARDTIRRVATPWQRLFGALEAAQTERVALLSIEPDSEGRTVSVTGEAKDYLATLTYVGHLNQESALKRVHLVRHEARDGSERPVLFTVSAAWKHVR